MPDLDLSDDPQDGLLILSATDGPQLVTLDGTLDVVELDLEGQDDDQPLLGLIRTGPPGPQGLQGPAGQPGERGPQGVEGPVGGRGPQGLTGPPGEDGPRGYDGPQGNPGEQGLKGDKGDRGDVGPQGDRGQRGFVGDRGPAGADGAAGTAGDRGPQGDPGVAGPRGPAGERGPQGVPGADGRDGAQGAAGSPGADGLPGDRGPRGLPGPAGDVGPAGSPGPAGPPGGGAHAVALAAIAAYHVVAYDDHERAYLADPSRLDDASRVVGVSSTSALAGEVLQVTTDGILEGLSGLTVGPQFLGADGQLSAVPSTFGFQLQVGVALSTTVLLVRPQFPITL